jgi:hypothetical protein
MLTPDYPEFKPNLTPYEIFNRGSFGGTYWRPIYSEVVSKNLRNQHLKYEWDINSNLLDCPDYDASKNKYGVECGTSLEYWESKGWIKEQDPYGWVQWYCEFFNGRRSPDDARQVKRWVAFVTRFKNRRTKKVLQSLQHWAYDPIMQS